MKYKKIYWSLTSSWKLNSVALRIKFFLEDPFWSVKFLFVHNVKPFFRNIVKKIHCLFYGHKYYTESNFGNVHCKNCYKLK
jgi:hypothetical protein